MRFTYLTCALLALSAVPAFCTPVSYTDRSSWLNAVASPSTSDFENALGNYSTAAGYSTGLVLPDGPTFVGMDVVNVVSGFYLAINDSTLSQYWNFGSGNSLWWSAYGGTVTSSVLHVTWPTPVTAFALDIMTSGGSGVSYTAKINNDNSLVYTTSSTPAWPNRGFFGLTSDTQISSIDIYLPTSAVFVTPLIDNFSYSTSLAGSGPSGPGDVPEPRSFLLIASGLIGLALMGRRLHRPVAQVS